MATSQQSKGTTLADLQQIILADDGRIEQQIKSDQDEFERLRQAIIIEARQNRILENDLKELDSTIKRHVRQKMSVREVLVHSNSISSKQHTESSAKKTIENEIHYSNFFFVLQQEPHYLAMLSRIALAPELPQFIEFVIFSLYGDQYDPLLDRLLLMMFEMMLRDELAACDDMGTFLRANTPIIQMMSKYCKRGQGMALLKDMLAEPLTEIALDSNLDLEINPIQVYKNLIKEEEMNSGTECSLPKDATQEQMAAHPRVVELVQKRVTKLSQICEKLLSRVINHVNNVPFGIRWISRTMRDLCMEKWPAASPEEVNALIGGLFFLRYVSPALTTPDSMNIIQATVSYRRNFILVTKVIQNLSNGIKFSAELKEPFMVPMNSFLEESQPKLKDFFDELCNVGDLDEHIRLELMCARSDRGIVLTTSYLDILHMHSLVEKYCDKLSEKDTENNMLRRALQNLGQSPQKPKREDDFAVTLNLGGPGHVSTYALQEEGNDPADEVYTRLRQSLVSILKTCTPLPEVVARQPNFLSAITTLKTEAAAKKNFELSSRLADILHDVAHLITSQTRFKNPEQVYTALSRDISKNVNVHQNISRNLNSARKIIEDIRKTRKDMEDTLAVHTAYLENVERQNNFNSEELKKMMKKMKLPDKEFTHRELEQRRVIIESRLPLEVRQRVKFVFSTKDCSSFTITAKYKMVPAFQVELQLKELLTRLDNDETEFMVANEIKLNLNLLMHLLNTHFLAKSEKLKDRIGNPMYGVVPDS